MNCFLSVKKIDSIRYLQVIFIRGTGSPHSVKEGASFFIKLADSSFVELKNLKAESSCRGCAYTGRFSGSQAEGSRTTYILGDKTIEILRRTPINKIRIYTSEGYSQSDIKQQKSDVLMKELILIDQ